MDVIRSVAMDIITNPAYHAFSSKKRPLFSAPLLIRALALTCRSHRWGCVHNENSMAKIVTCDICGGLYNQSHLSSHKRMSHGKRKTSPPSSMSEPATLQMILSLYSQLSDERKKEVLERLTSRG